jgi:probable F420-dependent oxidoreductase
MRIGIGLPHAGSAASAERIAQSARMAEDFGLDSVWVLDRWLRVPSPRSGQPLSTFYQTVFDPIETLAYVAAMTSRIRLGTSAVIALLQSPVLLARRLATIDVLSNGRLIAGIVAGWMPEEFEAAGVPFEKRGDRIEEYAAALRSAWGTDPVAFTGRYYRIPPSEIGPKPVQQCGIPLYLGGNAGTPAVARAGRIGDGLIANLDDLISLARDVLLFRRAAHESARDATALPVVARIAARAERAWQGDVRVLMTGTVDDWASDLEAVAEAGVTDAVFGASHSSPDGLRRLERLTKLVR